MVADSIRSERAARYVESAVLGRLWRPVSTAGVSVTEQRVSQLGACRRCGSAFRRDVVAAGDGGISLGAKGERTELPDHPLTRLLKPAEPRNSPAELVGEISWHLAFWKNAYCVIIPARTIGDRRELEILHPRRLSLIERRKSMAICIIRSIRRRRIVQARSCGRRFIVMMRSGTCAATR
jgi:hypothetical protein